MTASEWMTTGLTARSAVSFKNQACESFHLKMLWRAKKDQSRRSHGKRPLQICESFCTNLKHGGRNAD